MGGRFVCGRAVGVWAGGGCVGGLRTVTKETVRNS